ncbi:hypothetical protein D5086_030693 [Populus alba]|uniref:Uncharacterized protein n=1 Tax=Populus alba TaxID=43335 RepID=A0ACC4AQ63_POPAL
MDDDEPVIEAKDLVNSYVVALEDECDECCVVEDAETPMVLDDGNRFDTVNVELFQCLNGMVEEPALGMGFASEDDDYDPNNSFSESLSSPVMGLDAPVIFFTEDGNTVGKMVALNTLGEARIKISGSKKNAISAQKLETGPVKVSRMRT